MTIASPQLPQMYSASSCTELLLGAVKRKLCAKIAMSPCLLTVSVILVLFSIYPTAMSGRRKILASLISLLAAIALGVSAYLTWVTWQSGTVAGCTAESLLDCDDVLASKWSKWLRLPVSLLGGLTYLAILGLCWPAAQRSDGLAMPGLFALAMLAAGSAVWFVGLQAIELQHFCLYCLTVHCCGLLVGVLALLLFLDRSDGSDVEQMRSMLGVASEDYEDEMTEAGEAPSAKRLLASLSIASVGLVALMGGQLLSEPIEAMPMEEVEFQPLVIEPAEEPSEPVVIATDLPKESFVEEGLPDTVDSILGSGLGSGFSSGPRRVVYKAIPEGVEIGSVPVMGSIEAPHILVEMMDYTCPHCRLLHPHLRAAVERYGDQVGVAILHVPLSKKCNQYVQKDWPGKKNACDYAQLAIGVWKLAPEKFEEYHDWLLESEKVPNVAKARRRAIQLAGNKVLLDKKVKAETGKRLTKQATMLRRLKTGLPVLLLENGALRGVPKESEKLFEYLESKLGVEAR